MTDYQAAQLAVNHGFMTAAAAAKYLSGEASTTYTALFNAAKARVVAMGTAVTVPDVGPVPTAKDLTFGIEIECYIPIANASDIVVGSYHRGVQVPGLPLGWNAQSDGSLVYMDGYRAMEIVSPILQGVNGAEQVKAVCDWLKMKGARVFKKCGFHVHVGLGIWQSNQNVNRLLLLTKYWSPALYAITGTLSREQGPYCKTYTDNQIERMLSCPIDHKPGITGDRYQLLNLQPMFRNNNGTIETRVFSGTVNYIKMIAYIQIALGLAEAACGPIPMKSLKQHATGRLKTELQAGRVLSAVRELIRYVWRIPARPGNSKARGYIAEGTLKKCAKELRRLATEYQRKKLESIS